MLNKKNALSPYRQRKVMRAFVLDLTATQAAALLGLDRKTVYRYYQLFRRAIPGHQAAQKALLTETAEVDESFFGGRTAQ